MDTQWKCFERQESAEQSHLVFRNILASNPADSRGSSRYNKTFNLLRLFFFSVCMDVLEEQGALGTGAKTSSAGTDRWI